MLVVTSSKYHAQYTRWSYVTVMPPLGDTWQMQFGNEGVSQPWYKLKLHEFFNISYGAEALCHNVNQSYFVCVYI